jgi:hypothetical protein
MPAPRGLLQNRAILIVVLLACLYGSASSWLSVTKQAVSRGDPILIIGLLFAIFITASIASRSKFRGDRVVFGAFAGALVLATIGVTVPLGYRAMVVVSAVKSLLWTIAALASLAVLVRSLGSSGSSKA